MSEINKTELLIRALVDSNHSVVFFSTGDGRITMAINNGQSEFTGNSFDHLFEQFIAYYVGLAIENSERIDGGCTDAWHKVQALPYDKILPQCPDCGMKPIISEKELEPIEPWPRL